MDFIKNFHKDFILSSDYDFFKKVFRLKVQGFEQPDLKVRIHDIDTGGITFGLSDSKSLNVAVDAVVEGLVEALEKKVATSIRIGKKVLKAWEENPGDFTIKEKADKYKKYAIYRNNNLLNDDEYMQSIFIFFDKLTIHYDFSFSTGYGSKTYYEKRYFEEKIEGAGAWLAKESKNLRSAKIKKRIENYISKASFELTFTQVLKYISIPEVETVKTTVGKTEKKPAFPMEIKAEFLNSFLSETGGDNVVVDEETIEWIKDDYEIDFSVLEDWEIEAETDGFHNHDGQVCDYTVTFTSPDGVDYYLYNSHCLVTGWNFNGTQIPK